MAKLCRKLKWLVFFWDTVYIGTVSTSDDNETIYCMLVKGSVTSSVRAGAILCE